jgi:hypothetical protein
LHIAPGGNYCAETGMISEASSSGQDDCESRCTADSSCKYISLWETGGANWCRLNSACDLLGQQSWHTIRIYHKATANRLLKQAPSFSVSPSFSRALEQDQEHNQDEGMPRVGFSPSPALRR